VNTGLFRSQLLPGSIQFGAKLFGFQQCVVLGCAQFGHLGIQRLNLRLQLAHRRRQGLQIRRQLR
jgi:hypothetical protein